MATSCQSEIILSIGFILPLIFTLVRCFHLRCHQQARNSPTASGRNTKHKTESHLKGKHLIYCTTCSTMELHILCLSGQEQGPYMITVSPLTERFRTGSEQLEEKTSVEDFNLCKTAPVIGPHGLTGSCDQSHCIQNVNHRFNLYLSNCAKYPMEQNSEEHF